MLGTDDLLEREGSLAALHTAHSEAKAGTGRLMFVSGEAGVGKTTLVRFFGSAVGSARVLVGACDPLSAPRPLGPFFEIGGKTGSELGTLVREGGSAHGVALALVNELARCPTILVLEDLHWGDEATLDVVRLLGRRVEATFALVVATYRDDQLDRVHPLRVLLGELATAPGVARLKLEPLSPAAVRRLADGSPVDAEALYHRTRGNPFFVRAVLETGNSDVPETVRDAILGRAAHLGSRATVVLEAVAVAPPRVEPWLLDAVCADSSDGLDECFAAGLLAEIDSGIGFRHELARLAVEGAVTPVRKRALHSQVLAALIAGPGELDPARLAHHAEAAGDGGAVLRFAPAAASRAAAVGAHREAAAQYGRALRWAGGLPLADQAALLEQQAHAYYNTDDQLASIEVLRRAIDCHRTTGDVRREADALSWLVRRLTCPGLMVEAEAAARHAVERAESLEPCREQGTAYSAMAHYCLTQDDLNGAIAWGSRATEIARQFADEGMLVDTLTTVGAAELMRDGPVATGTLDQALTVAGHPGLEGHIPNVLNDLAYGAVVHRATDLAERYLEAGLEHCAGPDLDLWRLSILSIKVRYELNRGRWDAAADLATLLADDLHDSGTPRLEGLLVLALVRARRGDPGARTALAQAFEVEHPPDVLAWVAPLASAAAEIAWLEGRNDEVEDLTDVAYALALERQASWVLGELAGWRRRAGIVEAPPEDIPLPYQYELAGDWEQAAVAWAELDSPYEAAVALSEADDDAALARALTELQALSARPIEAFVARRLRERGVRGLARGPRRSTSSSPAGLTPRETEVLSLLAEGRSNAEIASQLYLSTRTVDHHVSAILRKLRVPSRARASAEAARLGIVTPIS
jgi:DNA-binding CsgD family transcriptional regulator